MPNQTASIGRLLWLALIVLVLFTGLCTIFAMVTTLPLAWQEHAESQWPQATAQIQTCRVFVSGHKPKSYRIDCALSYEVAGQATQTHLYSRNTPAPRPVAWQSPASQFELMQDWVDDHPPGTPIDVHYDPADHRKVVQVASNNSISEPRTPNNRKLSEFFAVSFLFLLVIARITRPDPSLFQSRDRLDSSNSQITG
ncbi:MAG TPA: DUF3592 domain-containing protein [Candidatus Sulfotelmatobacter sp.]|nr:DUF3592 domain-containing protein [Candidatus Sulfotelmatobacter sp.]